MKIDRQFQVLIDPLSEDERSKLEHSLKTEGCRDALVVWDGILLDGHNRLEICDRLGIKYRTKEISLPDKLAAQIWVRWNQFARRNLTDDQRALQVDALLEDLTTQSKKERASKGGKVRATYVNKEPNLEADVPPEQEPKERIRKKATKRARVSEHKVRQAHLVRKEAPKLVAQVRSGQMTLADAVREIKRAQTKEKLENIETKAAKAAQGIYDVIVIDPPWPMKKIERDERPNQSEFDYPRMTEEELQKLSVPLAADCHVWVWTTNKFLPMALRLLDAWGLNYVCAFVWHKPGGFQPIKLPQYNCEFALYARKGAPEFVETKNFPLCFNAPRGEHSQKPEEFYATVRRVTLGRRLDMFNRREIDGFDGWGKEA